MSIVLEIGREAEPLVVLDGFATDPDDLREAAAAAAFEPAVAHYPGVRAALPPHYMERQWQTIADAAASFDGSRSLELIDASFSIVATPADALSIRQRLPHCDAFDRNRIALVHYLSVGPSDGTAFFRHRSTGFETIDERLAPIFFGQLEAELRHSGEPEGYVTGDTPLFELTHLADARYNRALLYRSCVLHSGAIAPGALLAADPVFGRLTVTAFFSLR